MLLPESLRAAIEGINDAVADSCAVQASKQISRKYRNKERNPSTMLVNTDAEAAAYALTRMPATYAAIHFCMTQISKLMPDWQPLAHFDAGSGTGAAMWAAAEVWPLLTDYRMLERSKVMSDVGKKIAAQSGKNALIEAKWILEDLLRLGKFEAADLVTAAYVMNEAGDENAKSVIDSLWNATKGVLLIIEPGTPDGWRRIINLRDHLLAKGAYLAGPCAQSKACPLIAPDWCHFSERVNRSRAHRRYKQAELSYEDEKFSWLAFSRTPIDLAEARILRHPDIYPGHIRLSLCTKSGLEITTVTKSQKDKWRLARNACCGEELKTGIIK